MSSPSVCGNLFHKDWRIAFIAVGAVACSTGNVFFPFPQNYFMPATILDGKKIAAELALQTRARAKAAAERAGRPPGLAAVIVGSNPASRLYVAMKSAACRQAGFYSEEHALADNCSADELVTLINNLDCDNRIDGILVQLPLPQGLPRAQILDEIAFEKDVDGLSSLNLGKLVSRQPSFVPATARSVMHLLAQTGQPLEGRHAVIVGEGVLLGRPISFHLLNQNATVTLCHKHTVDLAAHTRSADVLVSAVGKPGIITGSMIKPGAAVIDVGITEVVSQAPDGGQRKRIVGDVDFAQVSQVASWITPVPGGVGPVTVAMLLRNTLEAFESKL